ncbi:MAG: hypothetical protein SFT68_04415 [Rickettsiaceae bacterium]|nr:hypothetical protein [Rickettsiaceae bacterium]
MSEFTEENKPNFLEMKSHKISIVTSDETDILDGCYKVNIKEEVENLSNKYVKYFKAHNINSGRDYYALVFERSFNPDVKLAYLLRDMPNTINPVLSFGVVKLSNRNAKNLVAIVPSYDPENNLEKLVQSWDEVDVRFIVKQLAQFLSEILQLFSKNQLNCGCIHPKNIIIQDGELILREPLFAYPHALQDYRFLSLEISDADPCGRRTGNLCADIYASGLVLLYCYLKGQILSEGREKFQKTRIEVGSLQALIGKKRLTDVTSQPSIKHFLNDDALDRWNVEDFTMFVVNDSYAPANHKTIEDFTLAIPPVNFNGQNYTTTKDLVSALHAEWAQGVQFFSEERVLKWIQRGAGKMKAIDSLAELMNQDSKNMNSVGGLTDKSDRLIRVMVALDPQGPIRALDLSSHPQSFKDEIFDAYVNNQTEKINSIINICLKNLWIDQIMYTSKEYVEHKTAMELRSIESYFNNTIIGCTTERLLYQLNTYLPCLSPLVYESYITELKELLLNIEQQLEKNQSATVFDSHIISFIASKINLNKEVYLNTLKEIPATPESTWVYYLAILSIANKALPEVILKNIALYITKKIIGLVQKGIKHVETKNSLIMKINRAAEEGKLSEILNLVTNVQMYLIDQNGYIKATKEVIVINNRIESLTDKANSRSERLIFGQRVTAVISYMLFLSFMLLMMFE